MEKQETEQEEESYVDSADEAYGEEDDGVRVRYPEEIKTKVREIVDTLDFAENCQEIRLNGAGSHWLHFIRVLQWHLVAIQSRARLLSLLR